VIKSTGNCLKAKNALNIVMATVEFSLDNNELKFAGLSGNQLLIDASVIICLKIILVKFKYPKG